MYPGGGIINPWALGFVFKFIFFFSTLVNLSARLAKLYYFVTFVTHSTAGRFVTSFLESLGTSSFFIGWLFGFIRLITCFLTPIISAYVDESKTHRNVLILTSIGRVIPIAILAQLYVTGSITNTWLFVVFLSYNVICCAMGPIGDSLVLSYLPDKSGYGTCRLWGALSFGIGNLAMGFLLQSWGNFLPMFWAYIISSVY